VRTSKRNRLHQIRRWLERDFPPKHRKSVRLRVTKSLPGDLKGCMGGYDSDTRMIYIDSKLEWRSAIDTLLHEWAHAVVDCWGIHDWGHDGHDPFFDLYLGVLTRAWLEYGYEESKAL